MHTLPSIAKELAMSGFKVPEEPNTLDVWYIDSAGTCVITDISVRAITVKMLLHVRYFERSYEYALHNWLFLPRAEQILPHFKVPHSLTYTERGWVCAPFQTEAHLLENFEAFENPANACAMAWIEERKLKK